MPALIKFTTMITIFEFLVISIISIFIYAIGFAINKTFFKQNKNNH